MVERLGWTLVHFVWEGALIALFLSLVLAAVRQSAKARYALACAALIALAAAPVVTFRALAPVEIVVSGGTRWTPGETILSQGASDAMRLMPLLVGVWAFGVTLLSVRLVGSLLQVERWRRRHARPADAAWQARFETLARSLGIRRRVSLLVSDRLTVPSAWGVLKVVVVLPASLLSHLSPEQVETILLHELAHVRRHDYLVNLLQAVVETALFYHPAVWWVSGVVRREREHCCDDAVVARLGDPIPYARALLHLEERRLGLPRPTLSAKEGNLMNRIARILSPKPAPRRVSPLASVLAATAVAAALLGGALQAQAQSKPKAKPAPKVAAKKKGAPPQPPRIIRRTRLRPVKAALAPAAPPPAVAALAPASAPPMVAPGAALAPEAITVQAAPGSAIAVTPAAQAAPAKVATERKVPILGDMAIVGPLFRHRTDPKPAVMAQANGTVARTHRDLAVTGQATTAVAQGGLGGGALATVAGQARGLGGGGLGPATTPGLGGYGGGVPAAQGGFGGGGFGRGAVNLPPQGGLGGGGFGRSVEDVRVEVGSDRRIDVDVQAASLATVLRGVAREAKLSIVIEPGDYRDVTMTLNGRSAEDVITILCRAAHATYRFEGDVYYVVPKS